MPEVCRFFGIIIRMFFDDHPPPHFHAYYGEHEALISISPIEIFQGGLPRRARSMVIEWAAIHQRELIENWSNLERDGSVQKIEPLE